MNNSASLNDILSTSNVEDHESDVVHSIPNSTNDKDVSISIHFKNKILYDQSGSFGFKNTNDKE